MDTTYAAWQTGQSFQRQLDAPTSVSWTNLPLQGAVDSLSKRHQVAIWIDRRIDPNQPLTINATGSLRDVLQRMGDQLQFHVGSVDSVVYLGPESTAPKLATLSVKIHEQVRRFPNSRRTWLRRSVWSWPQPTEPQKLLKAEAQRFRFSIQALDEIPHDLFAGREFPSLRTIDKLALVAAGFGKTISFTEDGKACRLIDIPQDVSIRKTYTVTNAKASSIDELRQKLTSSELQVDGKRWTVDGTWEDHQYTLKWLSNTLPVPMTRPPLSDRRYTLKAENQRVRDLVRAAAGNAGYKIQDDEVSKAMGQRTSVNVKNATFDELMRKILEPHKVRYEVEGEILKLLPAKE